MSLFDIQKTDTLNKNAPLAQRMRPQNLDEILGQDHIIGPGKLLRRAIETDKLSSLIFYGSPGCGKTTIATVIANVTDKFYASLNAVTDGVAELRKITGKAEENLSMYGKQTILFIDEIHRFNKGQQDALLPWVEKGLIVLIGATTQNPYFSLNPALLSRSMIFELKPLSKADIAVLIDRSCKDLKRGFGAYKLDVTAEAIAHLCNCSQGDARVALNGLELAVLSSKPNENGVRVIDLSVVEESIQRPRVVYDNTGDEHYDIVSAFIKSMRGSDPDAAIYYLARMLDAGEDPLFIARRIIVHAAEDVGLADPQALQVAQSAAAALQFIGMPEGRIVLAEAALYVAKAPKSNSVITAIDNALAAVQSGKIGAVPNHLKDAHYAGAQKLGHGIGYQYPHDYPLGWVAQQYLPDNLAGEKFYIQNVRDK
ncbi:MAG: replication-associated recombination protein A [Peptococcaceae bacterium]|nr:replication-associated recombination protein A [Peptococcaceae bacterium]MBO5302311.1 replication-associated recombination protein A [Peptococcaceae bacterium]